MGRELLVSPLSHFIYFVFLSFFRAFRVMAGWTLKAADLSGGHPYGVARLS